MIDKLKVVLINIFPQKLKNNIKRRILNFKSQYPKVVVFFNGSFTANNLITEIGEKIGEHSFDILMVHSSVNNLMPMYKGNVKELLDVLIEYSEEKAITLVMPVFMLGKKIEEQRSIT